MKLDNYKRLVIPFGAGLASAVIIYATGAQKSFVVAASLVSGSAGALIINNRKRDENTTSPKLADDLNCLLKIANKQLFTLIQALNTKKARNTSLLAKSSTRQLR